MFVGPKCRSPGEADLLSLMMMQKVSYASGSSIVKAGGVLQQLRDAGALVAEPDVVLHAFQKASSAHLGAPQTVTREHRRILRAALVVPMARARAADVAMAGGGDGAAGAQSGGAPPRAGRALRYCSTPTRTSVGTWRL